jgi:hypothetical protein
MAFLKQNLGGIGRWLVIFGVLVSLVASHALAGPAMIYTGAVLVLVSLTKRLGGEGVAESVAAWLRVFAEQPLIFGAAFAVLVVALVVNSSIVAIACVLAFIALVLYGSQKSSHWPDECDI